MTNATASHRGRLARAGLAIGAATATALAASSVTPAFAAAATITTTPSAGPTGVATPITVSAATPYLYGVTSPVVIFSVVACPATYAAPSGAPTATTGGILVSDVRKVTDSMLAVTAPTTVVNATTATLQKYNVCVYSSATALADNVGKGTYTVGTAPVVQAISPNSGPAGGGNTVVITGTAFPTTVGPTGIISASIDGVPLTDLKSVSNTAFSATMPAHSSGRNLTLQVNTAVGTVYLQNTYSYQSGISVTPNTAPASKGPIDVAVSGTNLLTPTFAAGASTTATGHVYLTKGVYDPTNNAGKTNPPVAECTDVLVFSNTDMICRMQLWQRLVAADGTIDAADTRSVTDAVTTASSAVVTSATANFTQADVGLPIVETGNAHIAASTTILSVQSPTTATMSANSAGAGSAITAVIGGDRAAISTLTNTVGSNSVSSATADFLPSDVGRTVTATGGNLPAGTIVTAVASDKKSVTLSRPSATTVITALAIKGPARVPDGAYIASLVSNGAVDANTTDGSYSQSVVSSSSTFTVANY
jgi:hypothetical protein